MKCDVIFLSQNDLNGALDVLVCVKYIFYSIVYEYLILTF